MSLIDLILNLAGLLLWVSWRSDGRVAGPAGMRGRLASLLQKPKTLPRRWLKPACLLVLLVFRGLVYRQIGSEVGWTPSITLGPIVLAFRSDLPNRIMLFSFLSYALSLGIFYSCLLFLSMVDREVPAGNPQQRWMSAQLGWIEGWPWWTKLLLPWLGLAIAWIALSPLLAGLEIVPHTKSTTHLMEQAAVVGLGSYIAWKYLIAAVLLLHIIGSYIYLGNVPFWNFINSIARTLFKPTSFIPLQWGKFDFSPALVMVLVFLLGRAAERGLLQLYVRLPTLLGG